jgi:hypothetical protein
MITQTHLNWADWFIKHENYDAGNSNLQAFSDVLGSEVLTEAKIRDLVDEIDTVILTAYANENIMLLHSPKNFGGTRSRPNNRFGSSSNKHPSRFKFCSHPHSYCCPVSPRPCRMWSAELVANIPAPNQNGVVSFEGSAMFIPGPVLRNAIIESN